MMEQTGQSTDILHGGLASRLKVFVGGGEGNSFHIPTIKDICLIGVHELFTHVYNLLSHILDIPKKR